MATNVTADRVEQVVFDGLDEVGVELESEDVKGLRTVGDVIDLAVTRSS